MTDDATANTPSPLKVAFAGLCTMAAVMGIGRFVYTPILPQMVTSGAISIVDAGTLASFNYVGYLVGALLSSVIPRGGNRANWLWFGYLLSIATTLLMAIEGGYWYFATIRFFSGIASAFAMIFVSAIVFETVLKAGKGGLRAMNFAGVGVGIVISSLIVAHGIAEGTHWQSLWLWAGLAGLVAMPVIWFWLAEHPSSPLASKSSPTLGKPGISQSHKVNEAAKATAVAGRFPLGFWLLVLSYGLFGFGYIITATFISALAKSEPQLAGIADQVWLTVGLACIPAIWCWNRVANRFGLLAAYIGAILLEAIGVALSVLVITPAGILTAAALLGATFIPVTAVGLGIAQSMIGKPMNGKNGGLSKENQPTDPRWAIAVMTASFSLGQMIGPSVAAFFFSLDGTFTTASLIAVAALILSAFIAFFVR